MKDYLQCTPNVDRESLNYIIETKHKYLLLVKTASYSKVLLSVADNYVDILYSQIGYVVIVVEYGNGNRGTFIVDLTDEDTDVLGYSDYESARKECDEDSLILCGKPGTHIIYSPQVANWLLDHGYNIIHLKPKQGRSNETVFVFRADSGFDECLNNYSKGRND